MRTNGGRFMRRRPAATGYGRPAGTSMASPYVSAVAALLHHQGLDPAAITRTIRDSAGG
ncbi:S8 family serine peptidase [Streptomyces sp. NPDC002057]|uniref:S8 family serine peptidase n=1 Tax=Streptomyces sp. NPDC002057 TaxID=3154664 RepID=UPI00331D0B52